MFRRIIKGFGFILKAEAIMWIVLLIIGAALKFGSQLL